MVEFRFKIMDEEYNKCEDFSNKSSKTQRENRSGGDQIRPLNIIRSDTFRGKVGEVIVNHFLKQKQFNHNIKLDFEIYPRGEWDLGDFHIEDKKYSIKSVKWFSNWLLLESKDIERGEISDYYILVTVDEDFKSGAIKGYATKKEILNDENTFKLKKGEVIPNTSTKLDANNHARHANNLHNTEKEWTEILVTSKLSSYF